MSENDKPPVRGMMGLLNNLANAVTAAHDRDRKDNPHRFTGAPDGLGPDLLFVENVARMLACNVDHVRRISRAELPASRVGNRLIYARADVEAYIASKLDTGAARFIPVRDQHQRSAQPEKRTRALPSPATPTFDPVARAKALISNSPTNDQTKNRSRK
jgi:hypothetical protein